MDRLISETNRLQNQLEQAKTEIVTYPDGHMIRENRGNGVRYIHVYYEDGKQIRRGINRKPEIIKQLARKKYLEIMISMLQTELNARYCFIDKHQEITADVIYAELPEAYKNLPDEYLFRTPSFDDGEFANALSFRRDDVINKWANSQYEQAQYREDEKKHRTSRGLRVRSKSEMLIAERLYENDIPFHYEEVLHIGEKTILPDFVIMLKNGKKYYWEHCGLTKDPTYMARHRRKMELYEKIDITPWNNLIVTYDDKDGNLDAAVIDTIIKTLLVQEQ